MNIIFRPIPISLSCFSSVYQTHFFFAFSNFLCHSSSLSFSSCLPTPFQFLHFFIRFSFFILQKTCGVQHPCLSLFRIFSVYPFLSSCPSDFTVTKSFLPFNIQVFDFFLITSSYSALTQTFFSSSLNPSVPCMFPPPRITAAALTQQASQPSFCLLHSACYFPSLNFLLDSFSFIIVNNNSRKAAFHRDQKGRSLTMNFTI